MGAIIASKTTAAKLAVGDQLTPVNSFNRVEWSDTDKKASYCLEIESPGGV